MPIAVPIVRQDFAAERGRRHRAAQRDLEEVPLGLSGEAHLANPHAFQGIAARKRGRRHGRVRGIEAVHRGARRGIPLRAASREGRKRHRGIGRRLGDAGLGEASEEAACSGVARVACFAKERGGERVVRRHPEPFEEQEAKDRAVGSAAAIAGLSAGIGVLFVARQARVAAVQELLWTAPPRPEPPRPAAARRRRPDAVEDSRTRMRKKARELPKARAHVEPEHRPFFLARPTCSECLRILDGAVGAAKDADLFGTRHASDSIGDRRITRGELRALRQFEVGELEAGGDGAAHQAMRRPRGELGAEPRAGRDDNLRPLARGQVEAEARDVGTTIGVEPDLQRTTLVEMKNLVREKAVKERRGLASGSSRSRWPCPQRAARRAPLPTRAPARDGSPRRSRARGAEPAPDGQRCPSRGLADRRSRPKRYHRRRDCTAPRKVASSSTFVTHRDPFAANHRAILTAPSSAIARIPSPYVETPATSFHWARSRRQIGSVLETFRGSTLAMPPRRLSSLPSR